MAASIGGRRGQLHRLDARSAHTAAEAIAADEEAEPVAELVTHAEADLGLRIAGAVFECRAAWSGRTSCGRPPYRKAFGREQHLARSPDRRMSWKPEIAAAHIDVGARGNRHDVFARLEQRV